MLTGQTLCVRLYGGKSLAVSHYKPNLLILSIYLEHICTCLINIVYRHIEGLNIVGISKKKLLRYDLI